MEWKGIKGQIREQVSMKRYTSMRVGGKAKWLVYPQDAADLARIIRAARDQGVRYRFLGNGTNLIVADRGFDGIVVRTTALSGVRWTADRTNARVTVGAGYSLKKLIGESAARGLSGLEKLFGIPGTVGGAVKMNAGSFGSSISHCMVDLDLLDGEGIARTVEKGHLKLGYRTSGLGLDECITAVRFSLANREPEAIKEDMDFVWNERLNKHPMEWPSAGSIFKNKNGSPAWRAIEDAGLRGFRIGNACISQKHPNFIVNLGDASALDVKSLIEKVKKEVYEKEGTIMEEEVEMWGFDG